MTAQNNNRSCRKKSTSVSSPERSYCTHCHGKYYRSQMVEVYYILLKKSVFHCQKCLSANADNLYKIFSNKQHHLLELFSGSKTVSSVAESLGFTSCSIDINNQFAPTITADIAAIKVNHIPNHNNTFLVWASVPCTCFSILNCKTHFKKISFTHRKYSYWPITKEAKRSVALLEKTLHIIRSINPTYYIIENPRGVLRHLPQIKSIPFRSSISYNDYAAGIYKPTDLFHNIPFLKLQKITTSVGKKFAGQVAQMKDSYERSIVPPQLVHSIITQIKSHHKF